MLLHDIDLLTVYCTELSKPLDLVLSAVDRLSVVMAGI